MRVEVKQGAGDDLGGRDEVAMVKFAMDDLFARGIEGHGKSISLDSAVEELERMVRESRKTLLQVRHSSV